MFQGEKDSPNTSFYEEWADSIKRRCDYENKEQLSRTKPCTIHRVPDSIRIVDRGAYEPKMLSIGPYHRWDNNVRGMEDVKWHYLKGVLRRYPERRLIDCLEEMAGLEVQFRGFYNEVIDMRSRDFVEMMLLDGCFILELLLIEEVKNGAVLELLNREGKNAAVIELLRTETENAAGKVVDPIYCTNWILPIISLDMLLLENQLPFLVLQHLFQFVYELDTSFLTLLAIQFFKYVTPISLILGEIAPMDSFNHLLHLFHRHLLPKHSCLTLEDVSRQPRLPPSIPSATEILYPGIRLRGKRDASSILDVRFRVEAGVLEIPRLCINHSTNSLFRNLIAWEQCYPASGNYFTSYAIFMDCLIDTPQDVVVLKHRGIIRHWFGTDEEVALLFNKLCIGITISPASESSFLDDLSHKVARFRMRPSARWRDQLMRNYFRNPWDIINYQFTAMTIIFTIVQTALAVVSLKRSS